MINRKVFIALFMILVTLITLVSVGMASGEGDISLRQKQSTFTRMVGQLINHTYSLGYELTLGDAWAYDGHCKGSYHYKRLAIDLNLFKDGKYLSRTEEHAELGAYWKRIGGTWGGDFKNPDGNHYSYLEGK